LATDYMHHFRDGGLVPEFRPDKVDLRHAQVGVGP
jgi:hypothetical protein